MGKQGKQQQGQQKAQQQQGAKKGGKKGGQEEAKGQLKTCNQVKARHVLCEKLSKCQEAYEALTSQYGTSPPVAKFGEIAQQYSECPSSKKGGDLGWFGRGKMVGAFQDKAFSTEPGKISDIFRTEHGYHFLFVEGRKN